MSNEKIEVNDVVQIDPFWEDSPFAGFICVVDKVAGDAFRLSQATIVENGASAEIDFYCPKDKCKYIGKLPNFGKV